MTAEVPGPERAPWWHISAHVPPGEFLRFIGVGIWNTVFGYLSFAAFTYVLAHRYPRFGYIAASLLSSMLNISISFLGYKWFVFKSRGRYMEEWLRCMAVYGSGILLGLAILPVAVFLLRRLGGLDQSAPYVGGAVVIIFNAAYGFIGNKKFTFKAAHDETR